MGGSYFSTLCLIVFCLASTVGGVNIARGKTTRQSSQWEQGAARRAVDGNTNTYWGSDSCTHTENEDTPIWWVDLGQPYSIDRVVIFNRQDECCWGRINPFNIHIGDSDQVSTNPKCGGDHEFGSQSQKSLSVPCQGMRGRYVGVRLPVTSRALTLCEVQVFPVNYWHRVFATVRGTGQDVYDAWTAGAGADIKHDKHPMVEQWGSLDIDEVKMVFESSVQEIELVFNGQNTNKNNWFTKNRLRTSPWNDIKSESTNYFSIEGHSDLKRRFFINRQYNTCDRDMGWLLVAEEGQSAPCSWERTSASQLPYIRVSNAGRAVNWNNDNGFTTADRMVIYIASERCSACEQNCTYTDGDFQCSCHAEYTLNEDGTSCDDVDECLTENGGCDHICTNTEGSFQCSCSPGYVLNSNGLACDDACLTATPLYVPHRSTAYATEQEPNVCDNDMEEGWYRFTHAGGTIPTSCVPVFHCSTEYTIWMNGSHPTDDDIVDRVACVNTGEGDSCCSDQYSMTIQVKRCPTPGHTYYVYKLVPVPQPASTGGGYYGYYEEYYNPEYYEGYYNQESTPSRCTAYCAGDSEPCPNGEEYNVFHRACGNIFPLFADNVTLHPPEYEVSANQVTFTCEVQYDPDDVTAWFDVMFLFDNEYFPDVPNVTLTAGKRRAKMDASHLGLNQLYPNVPASWPSKMGKDVSCQVRSYWEGTPDVKSEWQQSNSYWAGIEAGGTAEVYESADHFKLELTSTVPFVCEGGAQRTGQCYADVPLAFDSNGDDVCVADGCHVRFYAGNWSDTEHRVKGEAVLVAVKDGQQDGDKYMSVNFGQISHAPVAYNLPHIFHGYTPQINLAVRTIDALEATCTYAGDPHGVSFDELTGAWHKQIHVIKPGEFVLYRSTKPGRNFEVHSRLKRCGSGRYTNKVSCNCGVAVREDNDVVIVDYCNRNSPTIAYKTSKGGPLSPGVLVTQDSNGKYIKISMPSGAYVEVVGSGFVTLRAHAPGIDKGYTEGLCGFFDGNPRNDRRMPDGSTSRHYVWPRWHREFSLAWQIPRGESLFDVECPEEVTNPLSESQFCTCGNRVECSPTKTRKNNHLNPALNVIHPLQDERNKNCTPPPEVIEEDPDLYNDDVCDTEYEFDYAEDEEPEINDEWPTPNRGITEEEATGTCQQGILNLTIAEDCRDVYGVDIFSGVDFCVADVKVTEDFQYVDIIVQKIQAECAEKAYNNVSLYETNDDGTAKPPAFITENVCPRQCSNQGRCVNSTCECNHGYTSADCSIQIGRPPVALELPSDGLCDVRSRPCMKTSFFAEDVMNSENLTCRVTQVQIQDGIKTEANSSGRSEATFRSFGEVSCALPRSPVRDGTPDTKEGAVAHGMLVSVSNDGERFSEELFFTVYDSVCQECTQGGDCTWKTIELQRSRL
ncbi:von Willebrand factor D and EGF domain-containing protein-like [Branchiostoma floridae]|uniref:von Willebrand factor D and EGF domain-containing protein-like n=1 Tax=Branchiostoma floridae TaxID=7739 RepID=A0A9J7LY35_BRAFL|nr:von Willebrand factor D and EGF domain-containing protein-like [Branchiostoma floridae]